MSIINKEGKPKLKELIEQFFSEEEEVKNQAQEKIREIGVEAVDDFLVEELQELESKLYSKNMGEVDCSARSLSALVLNEGRAEQTCRNCGTVIQEKKAKKR